MDHHEERKKHLEWLSSLKVGDEVAVNCGQYSSNDYVITKISKKTPTGRMEVERFKNKVFDNEGVERGTSGAWTRANRILPVTKEITDLLERKRLFKEINEIRWETVPADKIAEVLKILN